MKKLFSVLMAAILLVLPVSLSACSGGWQEIQSITYTTSTGSKTLTSTYEWNLIRNDDISKEEYDSVSNEFKYPIGSIIQSYGTIPIDRDNFLSELSQKKGKTYYRCICDINEYEESIEILGYEQVYFDNYDTFFIKIKFVDKSEFEIQYYENEEIITKHVFPLSYEITYFDE